MLIDENGLYYFECIIHPLHYIYSFATKHSAIVHWNRIQQMKRDNIILAANRYVVHERY